MPPALPPLPSARVRSPTRQLRGKLQPGPVPEINVNGHNGGLTWPIQLDTSMCTEDFDPS